MMPPCISLIHQHVVRWDGEAAQALSIVVAGGCMVVVHLDTGGSLDFGAIVQDTGLAWSLAQVIRKQAPGVPLVEELAG